MTHSYLALGARHRSHWRIGMLLNWMARVANVLITMSMVLAFIPERSSAGTPNSSPLRYFVGKWDCNGKFASNGKLISATIIFDWSEATETLLVRHDDRIPSVYHAIEMWGPSKSGELRNSIADAYSGIRWFTSDGVAESRLSWTRKESGSVERFTYIQKDENTMQVDWLVAKTGGHMVLGDSLICVRQS